MNNTELLRAVSNGNHQAFAELYQSHKRPMLAYATAVLGGDRSAAEDAVDEAFTDIWKRAGSFDGQGSAAGWVRRIVRNKAIDILRKQAGREVSPSEGFFEGLADDTPDPEAQAISADEGFRLGQSLAVLNRDQREAIVLCYYNGLSLQEIAATMGCPTNTVKTRLHHARRKLFDHFRLEDAGNGASQLGGMAAA